ncbi:MAG: pilus assembly protein [Acidimicrobiia bacterium]|nr:pilus assembly protein [Acidimicrobiia bacterium]
MRRHSKRNRGGNDRGAAAVEFALILPILVMLVFGTVEFGRAYNANVTLTHAAREGVRILAITQDAAQASTAAVAAATSLDPAQIAVSTTACDPGQPTQVSLTYPFTYDIPLLGTNTIMLNGTGVMRCGG